MRRSIVESSFVLLPLAAILYVASAFVQPPSMGLGHAGEQTSREIESWFNGTTTQRLERNRSPERARIRFSGDDHIAALEAIHFTLTQVGDGATFVWRRRQGELSGLVRPTSSFRDGRGKICRHIVFTMSHAHLTRRVEGIACRQEDGSWELG